MKSINTQDLAASVADSFSLKSDAALGLLDELLFDMENEEYASWPSE